MMKKQPVSFRLIYLIYLGVLVALVAAAAIYVGSLLRQYEKSQPEFHVQQAVEQLLEDAKAEGFWSLHDLPRSSSSDYEANLDLKQTYLDQLAAEDLNFVAQAGTTEDELLYNVESNGFCLAQVKLKATGPMYTKLAVFSMRDWTVESVTPVMEEHEYTLSVPADFDVQVNGMAAGEGEEDGRLVTYTLSNLYLKPELTITDEEGNQAEYRIKKNKIVAEYFDYSMTLPDTLSVKLDGQELTGEEAGSGMVHYGITSLTQPQVTISDLYGNTVQYEGGQLPLTQATITASESCQVQVLGASVPQAAVTIETNPEYTHFADYVEDLPGVAVYRIAVLQNDAEITVKDASDNTISLDASTTTHNLVNSVSGLDQVPEEVSAEIDVLKTAQNWSLFLTRDLAFSQVQKTLIPGSYQYDVATKYAYGIDITFTSGHTLLNPAFADNSVTNFLWITDDCFSVDISFVKRMLLSTGVQVDDPMNDRFYFVKYDGTNDGVDNPVWKLASMKEIVDNAG